MYKIAYDKLDMLFAAIAESCDLFLPVADGGVTNYRAWAPGTVADLDTLKTVKSPKDAWFPQYETLYTVKRNDKKYSIEAAAACDRDFVVFGMKACDVAALQVLDRVFLVDPLDSYYAARREHGIIISLACRRPDTSCFCSNFDIDPADPVGAEKGRQADVCTWICDGELYWEAKSEKGKELSADLCKKLADAFEPADEAGQAVGCETGAAGRDAEAANCCAAESVACCEGTSEIPAAVAAEQSRIRGIMARLPYRALPLESWNGNATDEKWDSPVWEKLYKPCLGCGTCTFVCPTCQCYDIKDFETSQGAERYRCWDSCMYSDFTLMAHGNNRTSQLQRFRQRFMHKLVYFPANNDGMYSCVGCGRCIDKCPEGLNIVKVIKAFEKEGR